MKEITIGQRFEMGKQMAEKLDGMDGNAVQMAIRSADHPFWSDLVKHFGQKVRNIFSLLKTVTVCEVKAKPTADCFTNIARYYFRDSDLGRFLTKNQSDQVKSQFGVFQLTESAIFKEFAESVLGVTGDTKTLSRLLKQRGHTTTLPAIEALIERQENGEDVGLLTNGWANFFFVDNEDGESVSVVRVDRFVGQWPVDQFSLGGAYRWSAGSRFFLRNFSGN